jgi:SAM-dependent methyltransferase
VKYEGLWYHSINLGSETTRSIYPGIEATWDFIRQVRSGISYVNARVLDIASFDGMWAFEAEQLGASLVVATDTIDFNDRMEFARKAFDKFLYARACLNSNVIPHYNVSVHALDRLTAVHGGLFDIAQHLGLLYHLENPWHSLKTTRKCLNLGGKLLLETAMATGNGAFLLMNRGSSAFCREDVRTYFAPSREALTELLLANAFQPGPITTFGSGTTVRACLVATAIEPSDPLEFNNDYRSCT